MIKQEAACHASPERRPSSGWQTHRMRVARKIIKAHQLPKIDQTLFHFCFGTHNSWKDLIKVQVYYPAYLFSSSVVLTLKIRCYIFLLRVVIDGEEITG